MGGIVDDFSSGSGTITATVEETFEPLHTGHSLIFTIAPNGHVWGKQLDSKSSRNDVEIRIYAPYPGGIICRKRDEVPSIHKPALTVEQERKISLILSQKEKINYLLGTLMLRSHEVSLVGNYYHWDCGRQKNLGHPTVNPEGLPYMVKVVDCSYGGNIVISSFGNWDLKYDDSSFRFIFAARGMLRSEKNGSLGGCYDSERITGETHYLEFGKDFPKRTQDISNQ